MFGHHGGPLELRYFPEGLVHGSVEVLVDGEVPRQVGDESCVVGD